VLGLVFLLWPLLLTTLNSDAEGWADDDLMRLASTVKSGDTAEQLAAKLEPGWSLVRSNVFLLRYPFKGLLPYTNVATISEWRTKSADHGGWPWVLFALFGNSEKTNLVDLLWFSSGQVSPMIDGLYNRNLLSIKKGDSIGRIYTLLGKRDCEYFKANDGAWHVKFSFFTADGSTVDVEADAGTGVVVSVRHGYL
jgi:hypothetical protein